MGILNSMHGGDKIINSLELAGYKAIVLHHIHAIQPARRDSSKQSSKKRGYKSVQSSIVYLNHPYIKYTYLKFFKMAPKVFLTGISGYIGGQLLHNMIDKHPEYQITGLVRTEEKKKEILALHPSVNILIGDLESLDLIEEESSKADVVLGIPP